MTPSDGPVFGRRAAAAARQGELPAGRRRTAAAAWDQLAMVCWIEYRIDEAVRANTEALRIARGIVRDFPDLVYEQTWLIRYLHTAAGLAAELDHLGVVHHVGPVHP